MYAEFLKIVKFWAQKFLRHSDFEPVWMNTNSRPHLYFSSEKYTSELRQEMFSSGMKVSFSLFRSGSIYVVVFKVPNFEIIYRVFYLKTYKIKRLKGLFRLETLCIFGWDGSAWTPFYPKLSSLKESVYSEAFCLDRIVSRRRTVRSNANVQVWWCMY